MFMSRIQVAIVAALAVFVLVVPASALATPVTLSSTGSAPDVAVSAGGVGHFVWHEHHLGEVAMTRYCSVSPSATSCTPGSLTPATGGSNGFDNTRPYVFLPDPSHELLLDGRCCATNGALDKFLFASADGGGSFAAPVISGTENGSGVGISGQALYLPAGAVTGLSGARIATINGLQSGGGAGAVLQVTNAGADATTAYFHIDSLATVDASIAVAGGNLVSTDVASNGGLYWRRYLGSGDLNSGASWSSKAYLEQADTQHPISMAGGPGGGFVLFAQPGGGHPVYVIRRFTGSGFSAATPVSGPDPAGADLFEDPAGALHLVWQDVHGNLLYRYTTDPTETSWSPVQTLAGARSGGYTHLRAATDNTGNGWVTWDSGGTVQALPLTPLPPPPPPPDQSVQKKLLAAHFAPVPRSEACHTYGNAGIDSFQLSAFSLLVGQNGTLGDAPFVDVRVTTRNQGPAYNYPWFDNQPLADVFLPGESWLSYGLLLPPNGLFLESSPGASTMSPWDTTGQQYVDFRLDQSVPYPWKYEGHPLTLTGSFGPFGNAVEPVTFPLERALDGHPVDTGKPFRYVYNVGLNTHGVFCDSLLNTITIVPSRLAGIPQFGLAQNRPSSGSVGVYAGCVNACHFVLTLRSGGHVIARQRVKLPAHIFQTLQLLLRPVGRRLLASRKTTPATLIVTTGHHSIRKRVTLHRPARRRRR